MKRKILLVGIIIGLLLTACNLPVTPTKPPPPRGIGSRTDLSTPFAASKPTEIAEDKADDAPADEIETTIFATVEAPTEVPTDTPTVTETPTNTATLKPGETRPPTKIPTKTQIPSKTPVPLNTLKPSKTPVPANTSKPSSTPVPTKTLIPTITNTSNPAFTATNTQPPTLTYTPTPIPTQTNTPPPAPTNTSVPPTNTPVPTNTSAPAACSPSGNSGYESQVAALINQERANVGLPALSVDSRLTSAARGHSNDMACNNFFLHTSPTTGSPFDRITAAGYSYSWAGENIAAGYGTPAAVVTGWMNSSGHKANILNANYTQTGIGYAYWAGSAYGVYWTQVFAKP